mgnify:CR=1 FL=1
MNLCFSVSQKNSFLKLVQKEVFEIMQWSLKAYFDLGGEKNEKIISLMKNDKFFIEANSYLNNPNKMAKREMSVGDPESSIKPKKVLKSFPDWQKAIPLLIKSVDTYNNPISAFQALYAYNTLYGKNKNISQFGKLSKVFFDNEKQICEAYLFYGETLMKGYGTKVNFDMAIEVYSQAEKINTCRNGWYKNVIGSKILYIKNKR